VAVSPPTIQLTNCSFRVVTWVKAQPAAQTFIDRKPLYTLHKCYLVQCTDKGCTESILTWTPWQCGYSCAQSTVQQTQCLHSNNDPSFTEEEAPFRNMYMSRREQESWSWISRRLMPWMTVGKSQQQFNRLTDLQTVWTRRSWVRCVRVTS
jgi:hypothetical protein